MRTNGNGWKFRLAAAALLIGAGISCGGETGGIGFREDFDKIPDRVWVSRDFWTIPLEDWRVREGRLETFGRGRRMKANLLTSVIGAGSGDARISARLGLIDKGEESGSAGFTLGVIDPEDPDVRAACYFGDGLPAGVSTDGRLFLGEQNASLPPDFSWSDFLLRADVRSEKSGFSVTLKVLDKAGRERGSLTAVGLPDPAGLIVLSVNARRAGRQPEGPRFWFDDFEATGSKIEPRPGQAFGPILWSMYTCSRGILKLTAQLAPLQKNDLPRVLLQLETGTGWRDRASAAMDSNSRTAVFRIPGWDMDRDENFRLVFEEPLENGEARRQVYPGRIRRDPKGRPLKLAGMTCQYHYGFPYTPVVRALEAADPDLLYFSGDQIYEANGGYGIIRAPAGRAILNYLGKWSMFGWAFGGLMRDRPTICTPDDHDVFQGNLWGDGGADIALEDWARAGDSHSGYVEPPAMVNVVHRTQCAHLPDPPDPAPIGQGIPVWHTDLVYGGVSFAVVSDRMFKSGPERVAFWPEGRRDHVREPLANPLVLDRPGLKLLGNRQMGFLRAWIRDWKGADMKVLLSQTLFAGVPTHHGGNRQFLSADLDCGGWPQSPRHRVVDLLRRCRALHICGDQHLPLFVRYGIREFQDAGWGFCTPAITVGYQRRFFPDRLGWTIKDRPAHGLANTGAYVDGLGNRNYVYAVGNPEDETDSESRYERARRSASGFSLVTLDHESRTIRVEALRFGSGPDSAREDDYFPGWPVTIRQADNDGREPWGRLPDLQVSGMLDPVVEVIREQTGEVISSFRIRGPEHAPPVFEPGLYSVRVGDPDSGRWETLPGLRAEAGESRRTIRVDFRKKRE